MSFALAAVQRLRGYVLPLSIVGALVLVAYFFVTPVRTWNTQRDLLAERSNRYAAFEGAESAALSLRR
ncbi:MAG: hypothetical protein EBV02_00395 [Actinobacteria bacterium]|nr:hypothetical protein [Actinomycetota bacterium]